MNSRRFKTIGSLLFGGLLMLAVWVMLVYVASRPALKQLVDLTPQRTNSVDPVTVDLLRELRAQGAKIELHLFPQPYSGQVRDDAARKALQIRGQLVDLTRVLIQRYETIGGESVTVIDHQRYGATDLYREAAGRFGYTTQDGEALVVAVTLPGQETRHRKLSLVSDLAVIEMPQRTQVPGGGRNNPVPILKDYVGEVAISSAIKSLLVQGVPVIYLLRGYSTSVDFGIEQQLGYGQFIAALQEFGFEVRPLNFRHMDVVPADAAMVMVLEPRSDFAPRDAEKLFAYVRSGGRLFVNYAWSPIGDDSNPTGGRLGELLGYQLSPQVVYHKIADPRGGPAMDGTDGVGRLSMNVNPQHPTTRRLAEGGRPFELAVARAIEPRTGAINGVRGEPLLQTGPLAWLAQPDSTGRPDNRAPRGRRLKAFTVGMAFDVEPEDAEAEDARTGHVVLVSGLFCNNAALPFYGHFAMNVCNWMAERRVLLDIHGSRYVARSLKMEDPQHENVRSLLIWWVPLTFLLMGAGVWFVRRR